MSKKNLKNSAQNSNYKIEALEPRFMMDANVDLDGFGNQIDNFSSVVENRVDTLNLNLSDFGLNSSYNAVSQLLGGVGNSVETALQTIYGNYRNSLSSQVSSVEFVFLAHTQGHGIDNPVDGVEINQGQVVFLAVCKDFHLGVHKVIQFGPACQPINGFSARGTLLE
jgi:hypothetical protein